jgi:outer membrane receptor protein involved in Fe transport
MTIRNQYVKWVGGELFSMSFKATLVVLGAAALMALVPARGFAQRLDGTLQVEVTDKTGASVPGAKVTATNEGTKVVTDATGGGDVYVFPNLLPGAYTVEASKEGFNKFVREHVNVLPNQTVDAKAELEVGSQATTVEVRAEGEVAIRQTTSDLSSGFSGSIIEQLPVNTIGGDVKELAVFLPNTTTQPGGVAGSGGSVGGLRPRFNSFMIDGSDDNSINTNGNLTDVIEDAVADFTVLTNQFSAQYGHSAGGVFVITTKSGTNAIHGEAHEYNRNRNYDAQNKQEQGQGFLNRYDYNRLGASVGGPVLKDRLFYFGAFEYQDENKAGTGPTVNTPTAAGLATLKTLAHDPAVTAILNQFAVAPAAVGAPDTSLGVPIPIGVFQGVAPNFTHEHEFQINLDGNIGNHSLRGRYLYERQRQPELNAVQPQVQFNGTRNTDSRKITLNDVWTISPTLVNDFLFSLTHSIGPQLVVPSAFSNFPNVEVDSLGVDIGPNGCSPQTSGVNTYQWAENVTKVLGKHAVKVGVELRNYIGPNSSLPRSRGEWDYATLASFINDQVPDGGNGALRGAGNGFFAANFKSFYVYAQDDWKVTNRLTLNLGVRYEYNGAPRDAGLQALNAISNDPALGLTFRKQTADKNNWGPRLGFAYDPTGSGRWAIRGGAGVFYDITAMNFDLNLLPPQLQSQQEPVLTCSLAGAPAWCPPAGSGIKATDNSKNPNIGKGFLQSGGLLQVNVPPATQAAARAATQGLMLDITEPKIFGWTLSVQHQLSSRTTVELRYVGNHALELPAQVRLNSVSAFDSRFKGGGLAPLPTYLASSAVPATVAAPADTLLNIENFNHAPLAADGFLSVFTEDPPIASSVYHGGSVGLTHQMSRGLFLEGNYTWAHVNDDATNEFFTSRVNPRRSQDGYNIRSDWGRSALDIRNKFAMAAVYNLPNVKVNNAIARGFLHDWEYIVKYLAQTGQPVSALSGVDSNGNGDSAGDRVILNPSGVDRTGTVVDFVCNDGAGGKTRIVLASAVDPKLGIPCGPLVGGSFTDANIVGYVSHNPNARYVQAGVGAQANVGRNTISTPGLNIWDMSILKSVVLTERLKLQFRFEAYDVFNHPNPSIGLPSNNGALDQNVNSNPLSTAYPFVTAGNLFLNNTNFDGGSRTMQLGLKVIF